MRANETMLDVLRGPLALTGSKEGCGSGDCGACSIMVDGRLVCSCLMLAPEAEGTRSGPSRAWPRATNCIRCSRNSWRWRRSNVASARSGLLVASNALLEKIRNPTEKEVRYWLAGNLCRCTGYDKIVRAVLETAAEMRRAAQ